jgi:hypothetical protein
MVAFDFALAKRRLAALSAAALGDASSGERILQFWHMMTEGTSAQQLRAWQRVRDAGLLPRSAATFLLDVAAETIAERRARALPEYRALDKRARTIKRDAGFGDDRGSDDWEEWSENRAPREYHECWEAMERLEIRQRAVVLRKFGERELADMLDRRPAEYWRLRERGRAFFLPSVHRRAYGRSARRE